MKTVEYPLKSNGSGDLSIVTSIVDVATTRARILLDVNEGEREFLPEFGVNIPLFMPDDVTREIETDLLNLKVKKWCVEAGDNFDYLLTSMQTEKDELAIEIEVKLL